MLPPFPRKKEGDRLGAGHLNSLSDAAERFLATTAGGYQLGSGKGTSGLPPWSQSAFSITALGCDDDTDPDVYTIKPYYFNPDTQSWAVDADHLGFCLDDRLLQTGYAVDDKVFAYFDSQRGSYVPVGSTAIGGSGAIPSCGCTCVENGDITVDGYETTSSWGFLIGPVRIEVTGGIVTVPYDNYTVVWDEANQYWAVDIGSSLTAENLSGVDKTSTSTLDGRFIFVRSESGRMKLKLEVTATIA